MLNENRLSFIKKLVATLLIAALMFTAVPFMSAGTQVYATEEETEDEGPYRIYALNFEYDGDGPDAGEKLFYPELIGVNDSIALIDKVDTDYITYKWLRASSYSTEISDYKAFSGDTFENGYVYALCVEVDAGNNYEYLTGFGEFGFDLRNTSGECINAYFYLKPANGIGKIGCAFYLDLTRTKITSIELEAPAYTPKNGESVYYPTISKVNGSADLADLIPASAVSSAWYCSESDRPMYSGFTAPYTNGKFKDGFAYNLNIKIYDSQNSYFANNCTLKLKTPEGTFTAAASMNNNSEKVSYNFFLFKDHIKTEILNIPEVVSGFSGTEVRVEVEAIGDDLTYNWLKKEPGKPSFVGTNIFSDINYIDIDLSDDDDGMEIWCSIKDRYGNIMECDIITIDVKKTAAITTQPVSVSVPKGETAKVTVEAKGDGLTYQWWIKNPGDTVYTKSSIKTATYSAVMDESRNGRILRCVIKDEYGNLVRSDIVTISMEKTELKITKQPVNVTVSEGENAKVTVEAQGDGVTYQWWLKNPSDTAYTKSSIKTATYSAVMNESRDGRILRCVIKDQYGTMIKSDIVTISMKAPAKLKITKQPVSASAEIGKYVSVSVEAEGDGVTYQWWIKNPGDSAYTKSSIKTAAYTTKMAEEKDGRILRCVIKDKYGNLVRSDIVTINVK